MDDKQVEYLPFHAINEFMLPDFRLNVIQTVMAGAEKLPGERRSALNGFVKRYITVSGFRNSVAAPAPVKAKAAVRSFETRPDFVALTLQAWSDLKADLRQQVYGFLTGREWELLPADADRSKLPGFMVVWPKGEDYDVLGEAFTQTFPGNTVDENDLRLMIVWLANRLPYDMGDEEEYEDEEENAGEEE